MPVHIEGKKFNFSLYLTRYYITNMINNNHKYYKLLPQDMFCTRSTPHSRNSFKPFVKSSM